MANDFGDAVSTQVISQSFMGAFYDYISRLQIYTTDLSKEVAEKGSGVVIHYPDTLSTQSKATSGAYTTQDGALNDITVNLNQHEYVDLHFSDVDLAKSMVDIESRFIEPAARALAEKVNNYVQSLIKTASFSNSATVAASGMDYDTLVDIEASVDALGYGPDKAIVLPSSYIATLRKSEEVTDGFADPEKTKAFRSGDVGALAGFRVLKDNKIPTNSENLAGFAVDKRGLAIAVRALPASKIAYGEIKIMEIEGWPVRFSRFYDFDYGRERMRWEILFGASVGQGDGVYRITSA